MFSAEIVTPATVKAEKVLCKIDEEQPAYMPNIYWCESSERCCENEGLPSCCGTNITADAMLVAHFCMLVPAVKGSYSITVCGETFRRERPFDVSACITILLDYSDLKSQSLIIHFQMIYFISA